MASELAEGFQQIKTRADELRSALMAFDTHAAYPSLVDNFSSLLARITSLEREVDRYSLMQHYVLLPNIKSLENPDIDLPQFLSTQIGVESISSIKDKAEAFKESLPSSVSQDNSELLQYLQHRVVSFDSAIGSILQTSMTTLEPPPKPEIPRVTEYKHELLNKLDDFGY
ncbi:hypothetical protein GEMRC1_010414 [Eukaryota sp. GEM-RC1]